MDMEFLKAIIMLGLLLLMNSFVTNNKKEKTASIAKAGENYPHPLVITPGIRGNSENKGSKRGRIMLE